MNRIFLAIIIMLQLIWVSSAQDDTFSLTILHTSDTHAHHAPNSAGNGGVAIQAGIVAQVRAEGGNVVLFDSGDRFSGTLFHTLYKGTDQGQIMSALGYDAMTIGNHEFDDGDGALGAFISSIAFPVVVSNIDVTTSPELNGKITNSAILEVNGQQIGVIGLLTAETLSNSSPSDGITISEDYAGVANQVAEELVTQGVNKIVLLAHLGFEAELALIPQLKHIDVVLGGNSDYVFSNTLTAGRSAYPTVVEDSEGNPVYYAQAGTDNLYLGRMDVQFDAEGVITQASGDAILLQRYVSPDPTVADLVAQLNAGVEELQLTSIGAEALTVLDGTRELCRSQECVLGNVIADAMRLETGAQIAFMNGGGVRSSIEAGDITVGDVMAVHPFGNRVVMFQLDGASIREALENSVSRLEMGADGKVSLEGLNGRFLQVSGLRYSFDPRKDVGSRILSVDVDNGDGVYSPLADAELYTVASNNFVLGGGDGYTMIAENAQKAITDGRYDYEVLIDYLAIFTPIDGTTVITDQPRITVVLE